MNPLDGIDVRLLTPAECLSLREIIGGEFDDDELPSPLESDIIGAVDDAGKVRGFLAIESLIHAAHFYVDPDLRGRGLDRRLLEYLETRIPVGRSLVAIASNPRAEVIYKRRGW